MKICDVSYKKITVKNDYGESINLDYRITIGSIDELRIAAEVYGIKIICTRENGRKYENAIYNITANRDKIIHMIDFIVRTQVFPGDLEYVMDEILEKLTENVI